MDSCEDIFLVLLFKISPLLSTKILNTRRARVHIVLLLLLTLTLTLTLLYFLSPIFLVSLSLLAFAHWAGSQDFLKCDWKRKPTKTVPIAISVQHKYRMYTKLAGFSRVKIVSS